MLACSGTWIAQGAGSADRVVVDESSRLRVPPDHPELHTAPCLADAEGRARLLLRLRERGPLAALPHRPHAADLPARGLGGLSGGQSSLRGCGARRNAGRAFADPAGARLPLRAPAAARQAGASGRARGDLLAHSVAEPRGLRHLPVAARAGGRLDWRGPYRLPHAVVLQQLPRNRRSRRRSADRMGPIRRQPPRARDVRPSVSRSAWRCPTRRRRTPRPARSASVRRSSTTSASTWNSSRSASTAWTTRKAFSSASAESSGCSKPNPI